MKRGLKVALERRHAAMTKLCVFCNREIVAEVGLHDLCHRRSIVLPDLSEISRQPRISATGENADNQFLQLMPQQRLG